MFVKIKSVEEFPVTVVRAGGQGGGAGGFGAAWDWWQAGCVVFVGGLR